MDTTRSNPPQRSNCCHKSAVLYAFVLLAGSLGFILLAGWIVLIDRHEGQFILRALDDERVAAVLPNWLVAAAAAAACLGLLAIPITIWRESQIRSGLGWVCRWLASHPFVALLVGLSGALGTADIYELLFDPYSKESGLRIWMLREDLQVWLGSAATLTAAVAIWLLFKSRDRLHLFCNQISGALVQRHRRWMVFAVIIPIVMGSVMCFGALEGIPHFSDSLTYLIQGRILHSGHVAVEAPKHTDLFTHSIFFLEVDGNYFGKYPPGWPSIVGAFDRVGLLFMANSVMAGLATVLTGLVARQFAPRRVAVISALLFGLSPWAWFHGASFASHVASTCGVLAFIWLFLRALRTNHAFSAVGAGLALGLAVIIRPFDAAMFALPAIFMVLWRQARDPKRWLLRGSLIAIAALVGVGIYMAVNANTTGSPTKSPYALESRWNSDWNPTAMSMLARTAFQFVELNGRFPGWGVGGCTLALIGVVAAGSAWRQPGLKMLTVSTLLFFFGSTAFSFTNVWWGPRWLLPAAPLLAILSAFIIDRVICAAGQNFTESDRSDGKRAAAQLAFCVLLAGLLFGAAGRYGTQYYQHQIMPPHLVSAQAHRQVTSRLSEEHIQQAIVSLPPIGTRPPLDARAGMVFMEMPIHENSVIYVRAIHDWARKARESFPGRPLYEIVPDSTADNGFVINKLEL